MTELAKATITWEEGTITFEGSREFVESQTEKFTAGKRTLPRTSCSDVPAVSESSFMAEKKPKGHAEAATALGFFLAEQGTSEFSGDDIRRAYVRAGVRPPKVVAQALRDAKNKFDYLTVGSGKGLYKLTPHGDRTIRFDLPRRSKNE